MVRTKRNQSLLVWAGCFALVAVSASTSSAAGPEIAMGRQKQPPIDFSDRVVTFPAVDGIPIEADFYPVEVKEGVKTPIALMIHMYPADRSDWKPYIAPLRAAGIAVLAYDIRGHGGSTGADGSNLKEQYDKRDSALFAMAWMDAQGAVSWLQRQRHIDVDNMVVIGASIGSSIALDLACRMQNLKAVVCLSPGLDYFGVNSVEHIACCRTTPILLMSPEGEYEAVEKLKAAGGENVSARKYAGGKEHHGTGLFKADYGKKVMKRMMSFVRKGLGLRPAPKDGDKRDSKHKKKGKKKTKGGKKKGKPKPGD